MRRFSVSAAIVLVAVAVTVATQDAAKTLAGRWEGQRQAEERVDNVALVFTLTDKGLTGEVFRNGQIFDKMTNIVATPDTVTFGLGDLDFRGAIDVKSMSIELTAHFQGRDLWTMTVAKKKE